MIAELCHRLFAVVAALALTSSGAPAKDLVDTMMETRGLHTIVEIVRAAGLEHQLRTSGPYTLFAPTDEAFAILPAGSMTELMKPENHAQLAVTIRRHLLPVRVTAQDLIGKRKWLKTVAGNWLLVDGTGGSFQMDDDVEVLRADLRADNGVIHIIDAVLLHDCR